MMSPPWIRRGHCPKSSVITTRRSEVGAAVERAGYELVGAGPA